MVFLIVFHSFLAFCSWPRLSSKAALFPGSPEQSSDLDLSERLPKFSGLSREGSGTGFWV